MSRTIEPTTLTQGERIAWTKSLADYPADEWTLSYRFRGTEGPGFDVTAAADGTAHDAVITTAMSLLAKPGRYQWQAWVANIATPTDIRAIGSGETLVKRGFVAGATGDIDLRTPAKIMLDTIDAALLASGASDTIEYEYETPAGRRRVKRGSRAEVLELRKYWAGLVAQEQARERQRATGKRTRRIDVRIFEQ